MRVLGNPQGLDIALQELKMYMDENKLLSMIPVYVVTVKESKTVDDIDNMILDV